MTPAQDRRTAFLREVTAPAADPSTPADSPVWREAAERIAAEGPALGRTARWREACAWPLAEIESGSPARWAVVQGSVWLGYANL